MFLQGHEPELIEEDDKLELLDVVTGEWWTKMSESSNGSANDHVFVRN